VFFHDIVVDNVKTDMPAEMDAEQARQVLRQERAGATEAGDGHQRVVTLRSLCRLGVRIERVYGVERVRHGQSACHRDREIGSGGVDGLASRSSRIAARSSAISASNRRLTRPYRRREPPGGV
jgi:hypothetical protein